MDAPPPASVVLTAFVCDEARRAAIPVLATRGFPDYSLLDSGEGRKLERFGSVVVDRPEPQALWRPSAARETWDAHATFAGGDDEDKGRWRIDKETPESWPVRVGAVVMTCRLAGFRHLGLFPEQAPHWDWMAERIRSAPDGPVRILNLFAYTGAATLLAAAAGAEVTHVDASKKAVAWARENQAASGLSGAPIRWIVDDALKFAAREARRGKTYHVIVVDPPKFGRGPNGEIWELFEHLPALLEACEALLAKDHASLVLTVYAIRASALAFDQLVAQTLAKRMGVRESGELALLHADGVRLAPASLFTRWTSDAP